MLSYRHAFHAGNHADVLKHAVLNRLLAYLNQKDKPYWYIDTHAGAGAYQLDTGFAAKNAEWRDGIGRLWNRQDLPETFAAYVAQVRAMNPDGVLRHYPGSPLVALHGLRGEDRLRLFELHSSDAPLLTSNLARAGRRALIRTMDGFAGLKSVLPPATRRALTLIDPPYEDKADYARVVSALQDAHGRFATGVYVVWYPCLQRAESARLPAALHALPFTHWLDVQLHVHAPRPDGFGLHGSGLFIANPPWTLAAELQSSLPWLVAQLGQDVTARFTLTAQGD
jgi:23S rRNA (adenine2030-N6)-methyltransferase